MVELIIVRLEIDIVILRLDDIDWLRIIFLVLEVHIMDLNLRITLNMKFVAIHIYTWNI